MLYVFRRGSSSRIIGDDGRRVNMAMRTLENQFYYNFFFTDTHTITIFLLQFTFTESRFWTVVPFST